MEKYVFNFQYKIVMINGLHHTFKDYFGFLDIPESIDDFIKLGYQNSFQYQEINEFVSITLIGKNRKEVYNNFGEKNYFQDGVDYSVLAEKSNSVKWNSSQPFHFKKAVRK